MRVCIIFRGENSRNRMDAKYTYCDIILCWNNIKKTICDDLINNGHSYDISFITYPSEIIEEIKKVIDPKYLILHDKISQIENFKNVGRFMKEKQNEYDRFVILRCDFRYRFGITKFPKWNETGIFIVNRDVTWNTQKLYADILFMVDSKEVDIFIKASESDNFCGSLHALGRYLYNNNIPFHLMYEGYYHMHNHPLKSMPNYEEEPDLDNPKQIESITDVSQWN